MKPLRVAVLLLATLALPSIPHAAAAPLPTIHLTGTGETATATIWPGEGMSISTGAYVRSVDGPFELHGYDSGTVIQVTHNQRGQAQEVRRFPRGTADLDGLSSFFLLEITDGAGTRVARTRLPFCPASQEAVRFDDSGPSEPTMPPSCFHTAVSRAMVWGVDAGWAVPAVQAFGLPIDLPDGAYEASLSITSRWVRDLSIAADGARVDFPLEVQSFDFDAEGAAAKSAPRKAHTGAGIPDLVSLPPWQISVQQGDAGEDLLAFAATVWNAGTGPLVVEGFRDGADDEEMSAFQYLFDDDGDVVRRLRAGGFRFHTAPGHEHWHFLEFAQYSLLDRITGDRVRSEKESFCITWTDPVDLTLPHAAWDPGATSLATACGTPSSIWLRQSMPVGWGDTYHQLLAGQSFVIDDLPNGRYAIEVAANPNGRLLDLDAANDVAVREIELGGAPGARTVRTIGRGR